MNALRRVPLDAIALAAITLVVLVTHLPFVGRGMTWADPSWMWHFGNRTLHGDVPYRDYVFQVGPAPVYLDAAFQWIFGETYLASMYAAVFVKILRIWVYWLLVRRLAGAPAAALFGVFAAFDPYVTAWPHHWSTTDAQLLFTACALAFVAASDAARAGAAEGLIRRRLALAGLAAGMVLATRQSTFVMMTVVLGPCTLLLLWKKELLTPPRFLALWLGFTAAVALVVLALAAQGALVPAIEQLFLEAPQKKNVSGIEAILDALSGGALVSTGPRWGRSWWGGFLFFLGLPVVIAALVVYTVSRARAVALRTVALLAVPAAVAVGLVARHGLLFWHSDVPRTLFAATTAIAVLWPERMRRWFGVEPIVAVGVATLPLASDWALEMSLPGRGWGDPHALVPAVILFALASTRLVARLKTGLCAALAVAAVLSFALAIDRGDSPLHTHDYADGTLAENRLTVDHPALRGMRLSPHRVAVLGWILERVEPGTTCFIYGVIPAVYELARCTNPTKIDVTIPDFISATDAERAIAVLHAAPPDYLIAQEWSWMNPPINVDYTGREFPSELNPRASKIMHTGLRALLPLYDDLGYAGHFLSPELTAAGGRSWDFPHGTRIYRRKR